MEIEKDKTLNYLDLSISHTNNNRFYFGIHREKTVFIIPYDLAHHYITKWAAFDGLYTSKRPDYPLRIFERTKHLYCKQERGI
jgi:hypothetical protein